MEHRCHERSNEGRDRTMKERGAGEGRERDSHKQR